MNSSYLKKILDFMVYRAVSMVFPFLLILLFTKSLETAELGVFFLAQGVALWVALLVDFGFIRHAVVATQKNEISDFAVIMHAQIFLGLISAFLLVLVVPLFESLSVWDGVFIAGFGVCNGLIPKWYYQAKSRMRELSLIESLIKMVLIVFLFMLDDIADRFLIEYALLMATFLVMVVSWVGVAKSEIVGVLTINFTEIKTQLNLSRDLFLSRFFGNLSLNANILLVGFFLSPTQIAIYGIVEKMLKFMVAIMTSVSEALYPLVASGKDTNVYKYALVVSMLCSLMAVVGSMLVLPYIAHYVFEFDLAYSHLFFIMLPAVIFYSLSSVLALFNFIATKNYKLDLYAQIVTGLISLSASVLIVKQYAMEGAAISYLASSIVSVLAILLLTKLIKPSVTDGKLPQVAE